jgi:general secretion pathway protein G
MKLRRIVMHRRRRQRRAFTLIEVLLVLVILVILSSFAVLQIRNVRGKALINAAQAQVGAFNSPLEIYYLDVGQYPTSASGLEALRRLPADLENPAKWGPLPYMQKIPLDPWDRPYQYMYPGKINTDSYDIWSFGPDGVDGTEDDIGNWEQQR